MRTLIIDLRHACRMFHGNRGLFLIAVLSLALGMGATSTIFSLVDGMYLRPLPIRDPGGLIWILSRSVEGRSGGLAWLDYLDVKDSAQAFTDIAVQNRRGGQLDDPVEPEMVLVSIVSDNYFPLLGVEPARGRLFQADLDTRLAGEPAVAISDSLWKRRFGGDPSLVGRSLRLNSRAFTVVGILPPDFRGLDRSIRTDLWVPVSTWKAMGNKTEFEERGSGQFEGVARLRPGVSLDQAQAQLDAITRRFTEERPEANKGRRLSASTDADRLRGRGVNPGQLLLAIVGAVVLIASANVAMLLLAQLEGRHREISIRLAVGASRGRLIRQLLTEGAMLAFAGLALGLLVSHWLIPLLPALLPPGPSFVRFDIRMDVRVVGVTLFTCLLTVVLFGLAPALQAARTDLMSVLKGRGFEARRSYSGRNLLVIAQAALTVVLFVAAGLLANSFLNTNRQRLGFDVDRNTLVLFSIDRSPRNMVYANSEELARRIQTLPGVKQAAFCRRTSLDSSGSGAAREVSIPGRSAQPGEEAIRIRYNQVSLNCLAVAGTRVFAGRGFTRADADAGTRVVLINQTMARRFWPDSEAVGRQILVDKKETRIIGIVEDVMISRVHENPEPYMMFLFAHLPVNEVTFLVESAGKPEALLDAVKREMRAANPSLVILQASTLKQQLHDALYADWMPAVLSAVIGVIGMILAAGGLFGVMLHGVNRGIRETGVRMALGAPARNVMMGVLRRGLLLAGTGALIGVAVSLATGRLISSLLYGVEPHDPMVLVLGVTVALAMAASASLYPAWKAARTDPAIVLRVE